MKQSEADKQLENSIIELINQTRKEPTTFIPSIESRIKSFTKQKQPNCFRTISGKLVSTEEGIIPYVELKAFLSSDITRTPLTQFSGLDKAALQLNMHLCKKWKLPLSHKGAKGHTLLDRINTAGVWEGNIFEVIAVQMDTNIDFVLNILACDDDSERSNRKALFDPVMKHIGISVLSHRQYDKCVVIVLAEAFREFNDGQELSNEYFNEPINNPGILKNLPKEFEEMPEDAVTQTVVKQSVYDENRVTDQKYEVIYMLENGEERKESLHLKEEKSVEEQIYQSIAH